jgi:ferric-dicitrate binding protein FerR (iron transport regulator)
MNEADLLTDAERLEIESWCHALVDGIISAEDHAALELRIENNVATRRLYVRCMGLSASLQEYAGGSLANSKVTPISSSKAHWYWWTGAVAAALVAAWLVFSHQPGAGSTVALEEDTTEGIAMLASMENCTWEKVTPAVGESFSPGRTLHLLKGLAEVVFDCGARVMLQGPTTVELTSAWAATLKQGSLHANVPQEAIGFRVVNPEVDVVDLGTEFSVVTDESGASEVFVHQGAVEVHPKGRKANDAKPRKGVMREKESRRFAQGATSEVRNAEQKWLTLAKPAAMPAQLQATQQQRWDWQTGNLTDLTVTHPEQVKFVSAPFGQALNFDGTYGAQVATPKLTKDDAHTIGLWVRIAPDSPLADAPPFLSWRSHGRSALIEAGTNDDPAHGVVGALEIRIGNRKIVGTKSLRDGVWHHVAIVLVKVSKPQGNSDWQVRPFLDGRQEAKSGKGVAKKSKNKPLPGLWLASGVDVDAGEFFEGELGGLVLADGVLTQPEIRRLMSKEL